MTRTPKTLPFLKKFKYKCLLDPMQDKIDFLAIQ